MKLHLVQQSASIATLCNVGEMIQNFRQTSKGPNKIKTKVCENAGVLFTRVYRRVELDNNFYVFQDPEKLETLNKYHLLDKICCDS